MDLIKELQSKGFRLENDGNKLYVTPADKLTPELIETIKQNKQHIIELLTNLQNAPYKLSDEVKKIINEFNTDNNDGGYPSSCYQ